MVVILLSFPLQPQSDTKVIPDKKATFMTLGFIGRFNVGSVPRMRNKEVLALFKYKLV